MSHRFVWVDIPVHDLDRAIAFYAEVLGTAVTREGGPGFSFGLLAHAGSDVAGCLYPADAANSPSPRGPLVYLNVDGRIAAAERAVAARVAACSRRRSRSVRTATARSSSTARATGSRCIRGRADGLAPAFVRISF